MKKRVRIITYCTCSSIGSILQSFALSKTLKESGYENTVWLEEWNRVLHRERLNTLKNCQSGFINCHTAKKTKRHIKSDLILFQNI